MNFHYNQGSRVVSAKVFFIFIFLRLSREFHLYLNKCMINIILYCWLAISINQTILWEKGDLENNVTYKWVQSEKTKTSFRHIPSPLPLPKPNVTALHRQNRGSSLYVYEKWMLKVNFSFKSKFTNPAVYCVKPIYVQPPSYVACDSWCSCNGGLVTTIVCQISQGNTNVLLVTLSGS